jgi:hypothetical protein
VGNLNTKSMKKILIMLVTLITASLVVAQNDYRTDFENNPNNRIRIEASPNSITIMGHDKNEIIIEAKLLPATNDQKAEVRKEEPSIRARGLKPLTSSGADNTGIGLTIDKTGNTFTVKGISKDAIGDSYILRIPNQVKLNINDISPWGKTVYHINDMIGELDINGLNSTFVIKNISGPVILKNTNGNVEIAFNKLSTERPSSLTTVNGFIDITLPGDAKADFKINAINGQAYSDFDIKVRESKGNSFLQQINIFNLTGSINGGGAPFNMSAVNGNVYIRKAK